MGKKDHSTQEIEKLAQLIVEVIKPEFERIHKKLDRIIKKWEEFHHLYDRAYNSAAAKNMKIEVGFKKDKEIKSAEVGDDLSEQYLNTLFKKDYHWKDHIRLLFRIGNPEKELDLLQEYLEKHQKLSVYRKNYFYKTEKYSNRRVEIEQKHGWNLVSVFSCNISGDQDYALFKRPAPAFFNNENPWNEKGKLGWLPDLNNNIPRSLLPILESGGGHGGPSIGRRYACRCGEDNIEIFKKENHQQLIGRCNNCDHRQILLDAKALIYPGMKPEHFPENSLEQYVCECGSKCFSIFMSIEYFATAQDGWDCSWINIISLCPVCNMPAYISEIEVK